MREPRNRNRTACASGPQFRSRTVRRRRRARRNAMCTTDPSGERAGRGSTKPQTIRFPEECLDETTRNHWTQSPNDPTWGQRQVPMEHGRASGNDQESAAGMNDEAERHLCDCRCGRNGELPRLRMPLCASSRGWQPRGIRVVRLRWCTHTRTREPSRKVCELFRRRAAGSTGDVVWARGGTKQRTARKASRSPSVWGEGTPNECAAAPAPPLAPLH